MDPTLKELVIYLERQDRCLFLYIKTKINLHGKSTLLSLQWTECDWSSLVAPFLWFLTLANLSSSFPIGADTPVGYGSYYFELIEFSGSFLVKFWPNHYGYNDDWTLRFPFSLSRDVGWLFSEVKPTGPRGWLNICVTREALYNPG